MDRPHALRAFLVFMAISLFLVWFTFFAFPGIIWTGRAVLLYVLTPVFVAMTVLAFYRLMHPTV